MKKTARQGAMFCCAVLVCAVFASACRERRPAGVAGAFWANDKPVEVAAGRGRRGPWRQNESDFDYVDDPTVAIADGGEIAVAWVDQARRDVFLQSYGPAGEMRFARPVKISSEASILSWMPRLAIASDEPRHIYALWQEIVFSGGGHGGEIFFARSTDGGATFGVPINLSNSLPGDGKGRLTADRWDNGSIDLAAGPDGSVYAAWTEYEGRLLVSRSTDAGATFAEPVHIAGDAKRPARAPSLEVDQSGGVHLAWSIGGLPTAVIEIATSLDLGQSFGTPMIVASSGHADAPKIVADRRGGIHLVFGESPPGPHPRYRIRYARRDPGRASFSEPTTLAAPGAGASDVNFPDMAVDAAGRLYVVWQRFPASRSRPSGLGFTISSDGGRSFGVSEIVPKGNRARQGVGGSLQGSLMTRLAVNADGALALVDSSFVPGRSSHIWLWRKPVAVRRATGSGAVGNPQG